jgi:hypothetical protein
MQQAVVVDQVAVEVAMVAKQVALEPVVKEIMVAVDLIKAAQIQVEVVADGVQVVLPQQLIKLALAALDNLHLTVDLVLLMRVAEAVELKVVAQVEVEAVAVEMAHIGILDLTGLPTPAVEVAAAEVVVERHIMV